MLKITLPVIQTTIEQSFKEKEDYYTRCWKLIEEENPEYFETMRQNYVFWCEKKNNTAGYLIMRGFSIAYMIFKGQLEANELAEESSV